VRYLRVEYQRTRNSFLISKRKSESGRRTIHETDEQNRRHRGQLPSSVHEGLKKTKALGADGVQIYEVSGEMDPANLSASDRKELKAYIASLALEIFT
jgi:hypothetical protein